MPCGIPASEPFYFFVDPLESSGLSYCVTDSRAAGTYGEYRLTADIDFVVLLRFEELATLRAVFPEKDYYVALTRAHRGAAGARLRISRSTLPVASGSRTPSNSASVGATSRLRTRGRRAPGLMP